MLIVDSPFPPYAPVNVNVRTEPNLDKSTAHNSWYHYITGVTHNQWLKEGVKHREGDLPAEVNSDDSCVFYINGVKHRVNGIADIMPARKHGANGRFWLYGYTLNEREFSRVNRYAIKHELPLWVAVMAEAFSFKFNDLDELAVSTRKALDSFPDMNAVWLAKLWDVPVSWTHSSLLLPWLGLSDFLAQIDVVVKHEKAVLANAYC